MLPFELALAHGSWCARWQEQKVSVRVFGGADAPSAPHLETLTALVSRWGDVRGDIAHFVSSLTPKHHVPLEPPLHGGFAAESCGFQGELFFEAILVKLEHAPTHAHVTFYTGYPDGYATYKALLVDGKPTDISAFAS